MTLNRNLKMGMVGGGPGAFIGEVHRKASRMDGGIELVAGDAAMAAVVGEVETLCEYCGSQLRFTPDERELEVVRTRVSEIRELGRRPAQHLHHGVDHHRRAAGGADRVARVERNFAEERGDHAHVAFPAFVGPVHGHQQLGGAERPGLVASPGSAMAGAPLRPEDARHAAARHRQRPPARQPRGSGAGGAGQPGGRRPRVGMGVSVGGWRIGFTPWQAVS